MRGERHLSLGQLITMMYLERVPGSDLDLESNKISVALESERFRQEFERVIHKPMPGKLPLEQRVLELRKSLRISPSRFARSESIFLNGPVSLRKIAIFRDLIERRLGGLDVVSLVKEYGLPIFYDLPIAFYILSGRVVPYDGLDCRIETLPSRGSGKVEAYICVSPTATRDQFLEFLKWRLKGIREWTVKGFGESRSMISRGKAKLVLSDNNYVRVRIFSNSTYTEPRSLWPKIAQRQRKLRGYRFRGVQFKPRFNVGLDLIKGSNLDSYVNVNMSGMEDNPNRTEYYLRERDKRINTLKILKKRYKK